MGQRTVASATTARQGLLTLRPLLLLGGFVLAWWLLMAGAAQADEGPLGSGRDLGATAKALTGKAPAGDSAMSQHQAAARPPADDRAERTAPSAPVREVQRSVRQVVKTVATPVRKPVTTTVRTTVRDVSKTVENTPVKPVVKAAADTVRKTRAHLQPMTNAVRAEVRDLIVRTTADLTDDLPGVPASGLPSAVVDPTVGAARVSAAPVSAAVTVAGTVAPEHRPAVEHRSSSLTSASGLVPSGLADLAVGADSVTDRSSVGTPASELPGSGMLTRLGVTSASSVGSGSAPTAGAGLLDTGAHLMTPGATTTRPTDSGRRPAGPAYRPSCSPD